jgi:urea transport system permease protein
MDVIVSQFFTGASTGAVLLLVALGLALTFGQMGVINMAHGEFLMAGAYTAYLTQQVVSNSDVSLLIALPLGFLVAGLLGLLLEVTVISRMYHRPLDTLLVTFGVGLILQQLARDVFGAQPKAVASPGWLHGQIDILGYGYPVTRLFIVAIAIGCLVATAAVLKYTALGRRIRATVQNRDLAETVGVSTRATDRVTFFLGSGLAGIAGVALTLVTATVSNLGTSYIVPAFLVVVAGGIGQIRGSVIAAFALGILGAFLTYYTSGSLAMVLTFVLVVAFLQIRPQGLFTVRTRSLA